MWMMPLHIIQEILYKSLLLLSEEHIQKDDNLRPKQPKSRAQLLTDNNIVRSLHDTIYLVLVSSDGLF